MSKVGEAMPEDLGDPCRDAGIGQQVRVNVGPAHQAHGDVVEGLGEVVVHPLPEQHHLAEAAEQSEDEAEAEAEPVGYQYDLSIPPGWRVGGFASWHATDPSPMDCRTCATPMELLLTIDTTEWDGGSGSWEPTEDQGIPPHPYATPTKVIVGRWGELNIFACPTDPGHPHRWSLQ